VECHNCELRQRHFLCHSCVNAHVRDLRLQTHHASTERDEHVHKAVAALDAIEAGRMRRASLQILQVRVEEVQEGLAKLKQMNDAMRQSLRYTKERIAIRRRTLSQAKVFPPINADQLLVRESHKVSLLSETVARARNGLVAELVEVFNVVEVGGRPPIGGKAGAKGEWTIGDLVLPVPGDIRRYPPGHINAVITHTIHFIGLLTFYLGIRLPFDISWSGAKLGVGQPWIRSIKGSESGSWAKWTSKQCLHVSASPPVPSEERPSTPTLTQSLSESYIEADTPSSSSSFTTAYAMLLYDVCYLAHTQAVDVPLSQAGDVLSNLWLVCCSSDLGRFSHQTHPLLPPPTPPAFHLDFAQVLQATAATPASRARPSRPKAVVGLGRRVSRQEKIPEEDEWDLVDDAERL